MNKIEIIHLNDDYINKINSMQDNEYFILTTSEEKIIQANLSTYNFQNDITILNILDKEGYIYKKNIKNSIFTNFKEFITMYNNLTGIVFKKKNNIKTIEDLYSEKYKIENNVAISVDDYYKNNEFSTNKKQITDNLNNDLIKVVKYDTMLYDLENVEYYSENFIKLYKKYFYCDLMQGIIDILDGKKDENTYKELQQKYAYNYTFLELYQVYEKMYYIDGVKDVITW